MGGITSSSLSLSILNLNVMLRAEVSIHLGTKRMAETLTDSDIIKLLTNSRSQQLILICKRNKLLFTTLNSDFMLLLQIRYYTHTVTLSDFSLGFFIRTLIHVH